MGPVTTAVLDDTCGNLIQLAQKAWRKALQQNSTRRELGRKRFDPPESPTRVSFRVWTHLKHGLGWLQGQLSTRLKDRFKCRRGRRKRL